MALATGDVSLLVTALLNACGEDYQLFAVLLRQLEKSFPAVNWRSRLSTNATAYGPFIASGLSIAAWVGAVTARADQLP